MSSIVITGWFPFEKCEVRSYHINGWNHYLLLSPTAQEFFSSKLALPSGLYKVDTVTNTGEKVLTHANGMVYPIIIPIRNYNMTITHAHFAYDIIFHQTQELARVNKELEDAKKELVLYESTRSFIKECEEGKWLV